MSFFGKYRYHYQKGQERASCVSHGSIKRISYLCNAYAAAGCALSSSHPTTRAFRFPCSACAAVGCALPCCIRLPITIAALQCMIFFSIGLLVLIGLCFFYRLETSAPGSSGYYRYTNDETALNTQAIQYYLREEGIAHHLNKNTRIFQRGQYKHTKICFIKG